VPSSWTGHRLGASPEFCGRVLIPLAIPVVEQLSREFYVRVMPAEWRTVEIDAQHGHELLRFRFIGRGSNLVCPPAGPLGGLFTCTSCLDEVGLDPGVATPISSISFGRTIVLPSFFDASSGEGGVACQDLLVFHSRRWRSDATVAWLFIASLLPCSLPQA